MGEDSGHAYHAIEKPYHMKSKHLFKLYITVEGSKPESSTLNLHRICEEQSRGECDIVVIDLPERPRLAEDEKVLATPMPVRGYPLPARRFIGDLSDTERVVQALGLSVERGVEPCSETATEGPSEDENGGGMHIGLPFRHKTGITAGNPFYTATATEVDRLETMFKGDDEKQA